MTFTTRLLARLSATEPTTTGTLNREMVGVSRDTICGTLARMELGGAVVRADVPRAAGQPGMKSVGWLLA